MRTPEQRSAKAREDYKRNPEARRRSSAKFRARNKKKVAAGLKSWRDRNRESVRKYSVEYCAANKVKKALWQRLRKARQRAAVVNLDDSQKEQIASLYRLAVETGMQVDHIIPLAGCRVCGAHGLHVFGNLQLLSPMENATKQDRCDACWKCSDKGTDIL